MLPQSRVWCYAGGSYPDRPTAFEWEGRRVQVREVWRRERTPGGLRFLLLAEDGGNYRLTWDEATDRWDIRQTTPGRGSVGE